MKLDDLMGKTLDDLADLPSFEPPPDGSYTLELTIEKKKINKKDAVSFNYIVKSIMEQADPSVAPAEIGQKFNEAFVIEDNEVGEGFFKIASAPIFKHFQCKTYGEFFEKGKNLTVFGVVKGKDFKDGNGNERKGCNVLNLNVL